MTNSEYEAACITAALGEEHLRLKDLEIAKAEESLAWLQAERREIVNRYDLNKTCDHSWKLGVVGPDVCLECGAERW